jgi:hypothetical protein
MPFEVKRGYPLDEIARCMASLTHATNQPFVSDEEVMDDGEHDGVA